MNETITYDVLQAAVDIGVREFVLCAGSRNVSFIEALRIEPSLKTYYYPEERSAAFFALGRARASRRPVAVITTSGTAVGELLPAVMEACHSGVPLLLITADRPPSYRGSGAPQSCDQIKIFGSYVHLFQNIAEAQPIRLDQWDLRGPAHLNVSLEEPQGEPNFLGQSISIKDEIAPLFSYDLANASESLTHFLSHVERPFVIVSTLPIEAKEATIQFLLALGAPLMLEGVSGLREEPRLAHLRIESTDKVLETALHCDYPIDGVLRIGGVPTHRIWRDLESLQDKICVCAISELPFSGLSWNREVVCAPIEHFLSTYRFTGKGEWKNSGLWISVDKKIRENMLELYEDEPFAEASLIHELSKEIDRDSHIYLGNSLPIREWDLSACNDWKNLSVNASRGLNGIDGQISTFLGLCREGVDNWAIFGDLTTLYDMVGPWILPQLGEIRVNIVIVNNGGGKIFSKMFPYKEMQNNHALNFEPFARMWGMSYQRVESIDAIAVQGNRVRLIEIVPDEESTKRFWSKMGALIDSTVNTFTASLKS